MSRRLWWALLPYYGWTGGTRESRRDDVAYGAQPAPWYAWPLSWLWGVVDWWMELRRISPWPEGPPIVCDCDYCQGVSGARLEP